MKRLLIIILVVSDAIAFGQFGPQQVLSTSHSQPVQLMFGDFDYDGDEDFALADFAGFEGHWYRNDGSGNFTLHQTFSPNFPAISQHYVDVNGDGIEDILASADGSGDIFWFENDGTGNFASAQFFQTVIYIGDISPADFDNDGDLDFALAGISTSPFECAYMENLGNGSFNGAQIISSQANDGHRVEAADLDQDGNMDIILGTTNDGAIHWFPGLGNGSFGAKTYIGDAGIPDVSVADIDSDGDMDVVCLDRGYGEVLAFLNDGMEQFGSPDTLVTGCAIGWSYTSQLYDLDSDLDMDILLACPPFSGNTISWYEHLGGVSFSAAMIISTQVSQPHYAAAADLDGDGDLDVVSLSDSLIAWYENLGGSVGLDEHIHADVSLSPNPASDQVTVVVSDPKFKISSLSIFDAQGRLVKRENFIGQSRIIVEIGSLRSGPYNVRIEDESGTVMRERLVVDQ